MISFKTFLLFEDGRIDYISQALGQKLMHAARQDVSTRSLHSPQEVLEKLKAMDPLQGKTLMFLATKYINREFRVEDQPRVAAALERFYKIRNSLPNKDINQYKSLHDLYAAVEQSTEQTPTVSGKQLKRSTKEQGAEKIISTPNFLVLRLLSGEAACYYAADTKWCTSDPNTFQSYASQGDIYVIIVKDKKGQTRKFQYHYHSGQIMNERDAPLTKSEVQLLSSFPEWYEFIDAQVQRHYKEIPK